MAQSTSEILWLAPRWPFAADDGAKIATLRLLEPMAAAGDRIHFVALPPRWESERKPTTLALASLRAFDRGQSTPRATRAWVLGEPAFWREGLAYSLVPFASLALRAQIAGVLRERRWRAIVVDGLHAAAALPKGELPAPLVYRAHNVEADILSRASADHSWPMRYFLLWQAARLGRFEKELIERAALTCAVSEDDAVRFRREAPDARVEVVPIGWDFPPTPPAPAPVQGALKLLFVGRLDWAPNRDGLEMFLREIWPLASRKDGFELSIVGSGDGRWLQRYAALPGLKILGRVANLSELYQQAELCLVPLRFGSGTRVKAIEAARYARPCLSTELGVEGLGWGAGEYLRAETASEWIDVLDHLQRERLAALGASAFEQSRVRFSAGPAGERFRRLLETLS